MARIKYKEAMGFESKRGRPSIGNKPGKTELKKLYLKESKSIREIAEILGCSKDMVYRTIHKYGIKKEKKTRKGKLKGITLEYIEKSLKNKTKVKLAEELGVTRQGLNKRIRLLKERET